MYLYISEKLPYNIAFIIFKKFIFFFNMIKIEIQRNFNKYHINNKKLEIVDIKF